MSSLNSKHFTRDYNHYLMVISGTKTKYRLSRDAEPIRLDYMLMDEVYSKRIGELPRLYAIMHPIQVNLAHKMSAL